MSSELAEDIASVLAVAAYRRVAELVVVFEGLADDQGCPLTEVQRVLMVMTALQTTDGIAADLAEHLTIDAQLRT